MKNEEMLLSKAAIKARVNNTKLELSNPAFVWEEWRPEDAALTINWKIEDTTIGQTLIASTKKGICFLGFINTDPAFVLADLQRRFQTNILIEAGSKSIEESLAYLNHPKLDLPVHLHIKGTAFQINIWKKLSLIPFGGLTTYANLGYGPQNARAAGTAVGANPVSYILPCHRAVRSDGSFRRYYWGNELKRKLLIYENAGAE